MNNDAGRGPNRRRIRRPNQKKKKQGVKNNQHQEDCKKQSQNEESSEKNQRPETEQRTGHVHLRSIASMERLRDRVEVASHELRRLREENTALSQRIQELKTGPRVETSASFISFDNDPELLRRKITNYIEAIDRYLEKESE